MEKNISWKTIASKTIVEDQWIHIKDHTIELPNGTIMENYYGVEMNDWGAVFAITSNKEVIIIKQYRHGLNNVFFELPCGIIDEGEEPIDGCRRELLEETGYTTNEKLIFLGKVNPSPAKFNNWNHCYLALNVAETDIQNLEESENIIVEKVAVSELKGMIREGLIVDSFMISCIYLAIDKLEL